MFFIIITILLNVVISSLFKLFPKFGVDALQAIVVNYVVCVITGCAFAGTIPFNEANFHQNWAPWALLTGVCFISIFNLIAYCTRVDGITTTTIANKLSLVIPVLFSVFFLNEGMGVARLAGVVIAFPAVYLTSRSEGEKTGARGVMLPIILFIASGSLDTLVNYIQHTYLGIPEHQAFFTIFSFATAGTMGISLLTWLLVTGRTRLKPINLLAGICVGIPNYFSIYYLIRALNSNVMKSSATIPVINIGILVASALAAMLLFKEKAPAQRLVGLALAVLAIILIAL